MMKPEASNGFRRIFRRIEGVEIVIDPSFGITPSSFIDGCWVDYRLIAIPIGISPNRNHLFTFYGMQKDLERWDEEQYAGALKETYGL